VVQTAVGQEIVATTSTLTPDEKELDKYLPVPLSGPIPTLIDWDAVETQYNPPDGIVYEDYPHPGAPRGLMNFLREAFLINRREQQYAPVNVLITGVKGTGKTEGVRAFAQEVGLPYYNVNGEELPSWMLLGRTDIKKDPTTGASVTYFQEGVIPKAVRTGGILHMDELSNFPPEVLFRLDELLDNRRTLNMVSEEGEVIKAHPDLFIIGTMNPPIYAGLKDLPEPIKSRFGWYLELNPPSVDDEIKVVKKKFNLTDADFQPFSKDVRDFIRGSQALRNDPTLSYTPTMRETISFIQNLKHGQDFKTAAIRALRSKYYIEEEKNKVDEVFKSIGRPIA
jgi:nitric oxide reductase NorQ protein